jgi:predicted peptidase
MKRRLGTSAVVAAGVAFAALAPAPAQASAPQPRIIDTTVITEVTPLGYKVTGLALEYDGAIDLGTADIDEAAFAVRATLTRPGASPLEGARTVVDAYASDRPAFSDAQRPGSFIILELDENEPLSAGSYNEGGFTRLFDLVGSYSVAQVASVVGAAADTSHPGNGEKAQKLNGHPGRTVVNDDVIDLIVDDYAAGSYTAPSGATLPYRMFTPALDAESSYPLVVTLHGYGESGSGNIEQIAGNQLSVAFADPLRQARHAAFVLSPQADPTDPRKGAWWSPSMQAAVIELVEKTIAENPRIDPSRVYLSGLSMGSYGSWGILGQRSDLFAGALLVCGAGSEAAAVANLTDFPIWAVHSVDDSIVAYDAPGSDYRIFRALQAAGVPVTWSEWSGLLPDAEQEALAAAALTAAQADGSEHLFTTFSAGTTPLFDHGSWIPTYTNDIMIDWLFAQ